MNWKCAAAAVALFGLAGCGDEDSWVKLVPVTGTITLNDNPLADAQVTFLPDATNGANTPGMAVTGPDGGYQLRFKSRAGVSPGKYKVSVTPPKAAATTIPEDFKDDPLMYETFVKNHERPADKRSVDGGRAVAAPAHNEFEAEVTAEGGVFDFDVKIKSASGKP